MEADRKTLLLEKYWAGETSLDEERQLRDWFRHGEVSDELDAVGATFQLFDDLGSESLLDDGFDERVLLAIDERRQGAWKQRFLRTGLQAAAVVLLAAGVFSILRPMFPAEPQGVVVNVDTIEEFKVAAPGAFAIIGGALQHGAKGTERIQDATTILTNSIGLTPAEAELLPAESESPSLTDY